MPDPREPKPWKKPERLAPANYGTTPCEWCEVPFLRKRSWSRFCSVSCNNAMYAAAHPRVKVKNIRRAQELKLEKLKALGKLGATIGY